MKTHKAGKYNSLQIKINGRGGNKGRAQGKEPYSFGWENNKAFWYNLGKRQNKLRKKNVKRKKDIVWYSFDGSRGEFRRHLDNQQQQPPSSGNQQQIVSTSNAKKEKLLPSVNGDRLICKFLNFKSDTEGPPTLPQINPQSGQASTLSSSRLANILNL